MEDKRVSYIKFPSGRKKRLIRTENALACSFLRECFGIEPYLVSRDKADHIVFVAHDISENKFTAYLLGTDESGKTTLLTVGKLFYKKHEGGEIYVPIFKVVNDYKGSGIGTLLFKAFENYAVDEGESRITLCSLLSASKLKSVYKSEAESETGEGLKYLTYPTGKLKKKFSDYFDRNLYFYFSNGFEMIDDPSIANFDRDNIPLAKQKLQKTDLQYGVRGKRYLFRPTDPRFKISTLHIDMDYVQEDSVHFEGRAIEKAFVPFKCSADEKSLAALQVFLNNATSGLQKN